MLELENASLKDDLTAFKAELSGLTRRIEQFPVLASSVETEAEHMSAPVKEDAMTTLVIALRPPGGGRPVPWRLPIPE